MTTPPSGIAAYLYSQCNVEPRIVLPSDFVSHVRLPGAVFRRGDLSVSQAGQPQRTDGLRLMGDGE